MWPTGGDKLQVIKAEKERKKNWTAGPRLGELEDDELQKEQKNVSQT